jgi:hypothetical protein
MKHNLTPEQLEAAEGIKIGAMGTRSWARGDIVWAANNGLIIIATGQIIALFMYFEFILVPLTLAYFFSFLVAPLQNTFEFRPVILPGGKQLCVSTEPDPDYPGDRRYKSQYRRAISESLGCVALSAADVYPSPIIACCFGMLLFLTRFSLRRFAVGTPQGGCCDFITSCKLPHGLSVVATLAVVGALLLALVSLIASEVGVLLADEEFVASIDDAVNGAYDALNRSGVSILRAEGSGKWTKDELQYWADVASGFFNQAVLILLLTVYLMVEKTNPGMFDGQAEVAIEIEASVKSYISVSPPPSFPPPSPLCTQPGYLSCVHLSDIGALWLHS